MRQAFEWLLAHDREQALALVANGGRNGFLGAGRLFQEGRRWIQRALEGAGVGFAPARRPAGGGRAVFGNLDFGYGLQCARQAQQLFQQLGDRRGEIDAQLTIATWLATPANSRICKRR